MLDPIILDNTERLLAQGPYLGSPTFAQLHLAVAGSANPFNAAATSSECVYNWVLDCYHYVGLDTGTPMYRIVPGNLGSSTAIMTNESALVFKELTVEPSSGRLWAYVKSNDANDGLWLRANSVTAPAWTKVISAAPNDTQHIHVKSNGDIWYRNQTAGNWYQLQNGTAGNVQVSAPSGLDTSQAMNFNYFNNGAVYPYALIGGLLAGNPGAVLLSNNNAGNWLQDARVGGSHWNASFAYHINTATPSAATYKFSLPLEVVLNARFSEVLADNYTGKFLNLNDTYALISLTNSGNSGNYYWRTAGATTYVRQSTGEWARQRTALALYNKATNVCRYIGTINVPSRQEGGTAAADEGYLRCSMIHGSLQNANSTLDLLFGGDWCSNGATVFQGLVKCSVPLIKLDF